MAKELPYFKFEPSEWENGNIQMCSDKAQLSFIRIINTYWIRTGDLNYKLALVKCCKGDESVIKELIEEGVITLSKDMIIISFLDRQLSEFKDVSKCRAEAGRKGGQNSRVSPKEALKNGHQFYVLRCYNGDEEFLKIGTTKNNISRRYSGKMPYQYDVLLSYFGSDYIDIEKQCCEKFCLCEIKPKLSFPGMSECFDMSIYNDINHFLQQKTNIALAKLKRNEAIREDKIREENKKEDKEEVDQIISFLNSESGKNYKSNTGKTISLIKARKNEGFTLEDFKTVIRNKCKQWKNTDQEKYLRPETLFSPKFEGYLNEKPQQKAPNQRPSYLSVL